MGAFVVFQFRDINIISVPVMNHKNLDLRTWVSQFGLLKFVVNNFL